MARKRRQCYCGIGGQAVLEGVMMKNGERYAVAVRKPDQNIDVEIETYRGVLADSPIKNLPLVRGVLNFVDSLSVGTKSLEYSSSFYVEDTEPTGFDRFLDKVSGGKGEKLLMGVTLCFSFVMAIGLFMLLPFFVADLLSAYVRNASLIAVIEGLTRLVIFLGYMLVIGLMKDIRRLYCYHGAEHKCINCLEHGRKLTVENVRRSSRFHKRCGTSFTLLIVFISIILFFFIRVDSRLLRVLLRVALVPVIAGISYEILRFTGRAGGKLVDIIAFPGLLMQRLTTKEPDDEMIEVAMAAVEAVFDWRTFLVDEFGYDREDLAEILDEETETELPIGENFFEE